MTSKTLALKLTNTYFGTVYTVPVSIGSKPQLAQLIVYIRISTLGVYESVYIRTTGGKWTPDNHPI